MSSLKKWVWPAVYGVGITALLIAALAYIVQQKPMTAYVLPTPLLAQLNEERAERLRELRAATVFVYADIPDKRLYDDPTTPDAFRDGRSFGTGVVISPEGDMLTAEHVVRGMCMPEEQITIEEVYCAVVMTGHTQVYRAKLLKLDAEDDLAHLRIIPKEKDERFTLVPVIDVSFDAKLEGREVLVNGIPLGSANMAVLGIVSNAVDNDEVCKGGKIRATLAVAPGNSGGALLDVGTGAVVGITSTVRTLGEGHSAALFLNITCAASAKQIRSFIE
ncbi:hypothetical protein A3C87_00750 [Candidatus Kaiserbacteria bacterium RIFCSPHIGHO2_02_FULL_49_34]|uniref:Serine protease n=1 Tax=Candidatus Kaiserbacteria bacterium RIFCSPHIGHO2_02_FULL_49_34 TaxID=1798491 RepID=A0A1F6DKT1_9BACT|nr:MAG: hypothetical protein A3C87_00750 [Candidatus Kaiserbacteria bacterium RIFCSPHIGHO2_02_FULL_49_34]